MGARAGAQFPQPGDRRRAVGRDQPVGEMVKGEHLCVEEREPPHRQQFFARQIENRHDQGEAHHLRAEITTAPRTTCPVAVITTQTKAPISVTRKGMPNNSSAAHPAYG